MLLDFKNGQGAIILRVKLRNSSVTTGAGLTGLTSASTGLIISTIADNEATATAYTVAGSTIESITTLGTYTAPTATKVRFKEVDSTNHKGVYEIQIADARFAVSGAKSLLVSISGATNLAECDVVVPLRSVDPYDSIRGGMTALPNAAADAAGGLPISDTGGLDLDVRLGHLDADVSSRLAATVAGRTLDVTANGNAGIDWANIDNNTTAVALSGTTVKAVTDAVTVGTINSNVVNASALAADAVTEIQNGLATAANQTTILNRLGAWTGTGINTLLGAIRALFRKDADVSVPSDINTDLGSGAGTADNTTDSLQAIRDRGDAAWTTATGFSTLDAAGIRTAVGLASANLDTQLGDLPTAAENAAATLTTQMTEAYNADGTAPTLAQALFVCMQRLTEFAVSGTTVNVKKLDGSTTALTLTLDSSTAPTSSTRAT